MKFSIEKSIEILSTTPDVLKSIATGISDDWVIKNEGGESWSVYDIIGHLIHGEKTDWIPRMEIILSDQIDKNFVPFDRFAQMTQEPRSLFDLLEEFQRLRIQNIEILRSKNLSEGDLNKTGIHPDFGKVTLSELLSTWTVHDLNHLSQISRVMAFQYHSEVGPWKKYLTILSRV